jgi:hypothetical protein
MSCWWNYDIAVYGDSDKLIELEKALPDLTYKTVSGEEATVFQSIRELETHSASFAYTPRATMAPTVLSWSFVKGSRC